MINEQRGLIAPERGSWTVKDNCKSCGLYTDIQEEGFCRVCAAELRECSVCGEIFSTGFDYEEENICQDCNRYYSLYRKSIREFYVLINDIMSIFAEAYKSGSIQKANIALYKTIYQRVYKARVKAERGIIR